MTKSLYIHIPFCKSFCNYCDFKRKIYSNDEANHYIKLLIKYLNKKYSKNIFTTIYIGGGTPNCLSNRQLEYLLKNLKKKINKNKYEFTIECNPEFITNEQVKIFKKFGINRVSLGIQTINKKVLQEINRNNPKKIIENSILILKKHKITNISCDLIYGFLNQTIRHIKNDLDFLFNQNIQHISYYSLEIKPNSMFGKQKYKLDDLLIEKQLRFIINYLNQHGYKRYEVSSWAKKISLQSKHNLSVWHSNPWAAIGYGAHGFENDKYYFYSGTITNWKLHSKKITPKEKYQQILMMGFRLKMGLNLKNKLYSKAYSYFKKQLHENNLFIKQNNYIKCKNLNLLDSLLVAIF